MPKFTIVSGQPRSGTSLMMQTLDLLGVKTWKRNQEVGRDEDRKKHAKKMNPKGFFETRFVGKGINLDFFDDDRKEKIKAFIEKHDGEAVKVITRGLMVTDLDFVDKVIFCSRNPKAVSYSQTELASQIMLASEKDEWEYPKLEYRPDHYLMDMYPFLSALEVLKDRMLVVDYEDMHEKTEQTIEKIVNFLKIEPTKEQKRAAIQNVDPLLNRRSKAPVAEGEGWDIADRLYRKLLALEIPDEELKSAAENYIRKIFEKNATWLEESIWSKCSIALYNKLQTDERTRKILTTNAQKRHDNQLTCVSCPHYNRNGETYTIKRQDLDDLVRNKVKCDFLSREVSLEMCQSHWMKYRLDNNKKPKERTKTNSKTLRKQSGSPR